MFDVEAALVGVAVPILVTAIVFGFIYQNRRLLHEERMAMIEKGIAPEALKQLAAGDLQVFSRTRSLYHGILTSCIGLALLFGLGTMGYGPWLLAGLVPLAVGLGHIITYVATAKGQDNTKDQ